MRVRSVTASASRSRSGWKSGQRSGTVRMVAPARATHGRVLVVVRLEDHDLVIRSVEQREQRRGDRLRRSRGDEDVAIRIEVEAVEPLLMLGDRLPEILDAAARRVLVHPVRDGIAGGLEHLARAHPRRGSPGRG